MIKAIKKFKEKLVSNTVFHAVLVGICIAGIVASPFISLTVTGPMVLATIINAWNLVDSINNNDTKELSIEDLKPVLPERSDTQRNVTNDICPFRIKPSIDKSVSKKELTTNLSF